MAKLEQGLEVAGVRLRLTVQTEDTDSHSIVTNNEKEFASFVERVGAYARILLKEVVPTLPKREPTR